MGSKAYKQRKPRQVAALVYRIEADRQVRILLLTSLDTKRTIIPKGWPMKGLKDRDAAAREAFEEAGIVGKIGSKAIGRFHYWKRRKTYFSYVRVDVYALKAQEFLDDYPEKGQRQLAWFSPEEAAMLIDEPQLATLVRRFVAKKN
jgi:8-oxo-dGTP pyrophosphatase MutT (NUDIX family)